jgi:hypothetical protein
MHMEPTTKYIPFDPIAYPTYAPFRITIAAYNKMVP